MQKQEAAAPGRVCPNGEGLIGGLCSGQVFLLVVLNKGGKWICMSHPTEKSREAEDLSGGKSRSGSVNPWLVTPSILCTCRNHSFLKPVPASSLQVQCLPLPATSSCKVQPSLLASSLQIHVILNSLSACIILYSKPMVITLCVCVLRAYFFLTFKIFLNLFLIKIFI